MGYTCEFISAMADNPNIDIVVPEDGTTFDVEAIGAAATTHVPEVVLAFMNFFLQPPNYANFINTTGRDGSARPPRP